MKTSTVRVWSEQESPQTKLEETSLKHMEDLYRQNDKKREYSQFGQGQRGRH